MIGKLKLRNFRKHKDTEITFTRGLNVIRGPNEIGKTTLIEATCYAWFGAKALRDPLSEVVTWGEKESTLAVTLEHIVKDVTYTFTRSKSGAECNAPGIKVTGQSEVSAYAAELLGADPKTAAMLMLASQSGLRGALDQGPAAVSALMGKLADFDLIDKIIETATQNLLLGADGPIQQKLTDSDLALKALQDQAAQPNGIHDLEQNTQLLTKSAKKVEDTTSGLSDKMLAANEALQAARHQIEIRDGEVARIAQLEVDLAGEKSKLQVARTTAANRPAEADVAAKRKSIEDAEGHGKLVADHKFLLSLPAHPAQVWEGSKADFDTELAAGRTSLSDGEKRMAAINAERGTLVKSRITSAKCPTCGSASMTDVHVKEHNARVDEQIAALDVEASGLRSVIAEATDMIQTLTEIDKVGQVYVGAAGRLGNRVTTDIATYPMKLTWVGATPGLSVDVNALRAQLSQMTALERNATLAEGAVTQHENRIANVELSLTAAQKTLSEIPMPEIEPLQSAYDESYRVYAKATSDASSLRDAASREAAKLAAAVAERDRIAAEIVRTEARIAELQADLKALAFNNTLVLKLKKLKPAITDHLWNVVLSAVSTFFSTMRGEQSVVSKDAQGFRINDKAVTSFSGSTLDVLALAIRVALTKTFIPNATFMQLDEPAHGCDGDRTGNVLGFLSSVGFDQTILASHDELSEAVADNVILLGD